jgi:hypothetical protein
LQIELFICVFFSFEGCQSLRKIKNKIQTKPNCTHISKNIRHISHIISESIEKSIQFYPRIVNMITLVILKTTTLSLGYWNFISISSYFCLLFHFYLKMSLFLFFCFPQFLFLFYSRSENTTLWFIALVSSVFSMLVRWWVASR